MIKGLFAKTRILAKPVLAVNGFSLKTVLPRDSEPLSRRHFEKAVGICDWIGGIVNGRGDYIKRNSLDIAINNPSANWSLENSFFDGYRALISKQYDNINMLRVFSQMFSGHYLGLRLASGMPVPQFLPDNLNDSALGYMMDAMANETPWWLTRYNNLIPAFSELAKLSPPRAFGETGLMINDVIVNHDTYAYLERLALLWQAGLIQSLQQKSHPIIIEIGSGYGALAYYIKKLVPQCTYICLDLPESLIFSAIYLSRYYKKSLFLDSDSALATLPDHECAFVPNYLFHRLVQSDLKIDLAINTLSMSEMTSDQVSYYCDGLTTLLSPEGRFFEQNQDNKHAGLIYSKDVIARHFTSGRPISIHTDLTQGLATVWSN